MVCNTLLPAVELDHMGCWGALAGLDKRFQTQQENAPFGTAMMHEIDHVTAFD